MATRPARTTRCRRSRYGILRGPVLAGWRLLRCNPFSHGGYDPVSDQHLFRGRRAPPASLRQTPEPDIRLRQRILQPLIDFFEAILVFFYDIIGLRWGMAIIAAHDPRALGAVPADAQAVQVDAGDGAAQPEIKKLQEKYKNDKERSTRR